MMKWVFGLMIILSVVFGILNGRIAEVSNAAIMQCSAAVELSLALMGSMCLWSGLMNIAKESGLTVKISRLFSPVIRLVFKDMDYKDPAAQAICLNMSANLLGLGNAATPLGIAAMKEMQKKNKNPLTATNNMILFVVLNTASIQLIPTTTAVLRARAGAKAPLDIMPAVWIASVVSVSAGIISAKILNRLNPKSKRALK